MPVNPSPEPVGPAAALRDAARRHPDRTALTFVDYSVDRAGVARTVTSGQLHSRARAVAAELCRVTVPGDRVAILCPHTADYVAALLGCLHTGVLAVPLYAPEAFRTDERLRVTMADCSPSVVLTTTPFQQSVRHLLAEAPELGEPGIVCVDALDPALGRNVVLPPVERPHDVAYLQYTSGSTRTPAGVEVTHRNLAVAADQLRAALDVGEDSRIVGWLPFFHDMGLVMMIALPLATQTPAVLMSPFSFVQQPVRWLRAIGEHGATHTVSPNFGLDLCADRIPERAREGLDLSSLRVLVNGSEPVRPATLDRFTAEFGPHGFRHEAHRPGYGLAEATLAVTVSASAPRVLTLDREELAADRVRLLPEGATGGYRVVGCGTPVEQEVCIVDPAGARVLPENRTGEVWVRGANVCAGYWDRPERTAEVFGARLAGAGEGDRPWLRTGDLGFLRDGELHLTGRLKDLIVVDGRNHYASDLELTAQEADPLVRHGHVAAFPVGLLDDNGERAVVVAELERRCDGARLETIRTAIRSALLAHHSLDVRDVVLIRRGTLPKTTSGKIRRSACRDLHLAGALAVVRTDAVGAR
ncbi:fatty acyl-AMP ligase [Streptomyces sp. NPDC005931]|uniref:fatty acyl-AMP ligase n=1 Tax=Streptomyces sp. NPDC005931 TaxID=3364737 RepID=UPI0036988EE8